jgi:hypothetical protein
MFAPMTELDELWVVTCTVNYADQDRWTDEHGDVEWIDVRSLPGTAE